MDRDLLLFALPAAPALMGALLPRAARLSPEGQARLAPLGAGLALLGVGLIAIFGGLSTPAEPGTALRLDFASLLVAGMVSAIGWVVLRFGGRYLAGEPGRARFAALASGLLSAVLLMVVAADLVTLAVAWIATGVLLRRLLLLRPERERARDAARAQWRASRVGDASLALAALLALVFLGSARLDVVFDAAASGHAVAPWLAALLALAAMAMSALLPFHTWLPESMETPTPVSALLHAGVVNAGGVLLIRTSPLLLESPLVLSVLAVVATVSAVTASIAMLTQTDIKRKLAYSTLAQMGFMLMQCGIGAFGAAALHLVGHSCYKAYAFLSSGAHAGPKPSPLDLDGSEASPTTLAGAIGWAAGGGLLVLTVAFLLGVPVNTKTGAVVLISVLAMGVGQILSAARAAGGSPSRRIAEASLLGAAIAGAYLLGTGVIDARLAAAMPTQATAALPSALPWLIAALFGAGFALQAALPHYAEHPALQRFYVHARNGFYLATATQAFFERRRSSRLVLENGDD